MEDRQPDQVPFDEQAALEELERVKQEIERYRAERKAVDERFERFIRSFYTGEPVVEAPAAPPVRVRAAERAPSALPPPAQAVVPAGLPPASAKARRYGPTHAGAVVAGALILLSAGGYVTWTKWKGSRHSANTAAVLPPAAAASPSPAPATQTAAPVVPANAPPASAQTAATGAELSTLRAAWVRVIVDGQRVLERELPADTRVPLTAEKTIVIRTGDAGAVRLSIHGQDQGPLGRQGAVVTRTFTMPANAKAKERQP